MRVLIALLVVSACEGPPDGGDRVSVSSGSDGRVCAKDARPTVDRSPPVTAEHFAARTAISVNAGSAVRAVNPLVFGANHRYPYGGFNMWDASRDRAYPAFLQRFEYAGITSVRFPGGRTANHYQWRRAIGPLESRGGQVDAAFGRQSIHTKPLTTEFGPDEFGEFLRRSGSVGTIAVNFATGSARDAADWVEYMNAPVGQNPNGGVDWAKVRARNGSRKPYGIPYWEIGNELAGELAFWTGENASERVRVERYIHGGSPPFHKQPVGRHLDFSTSASLSDGRPSQVFYVQYPPARPASERVFVDGDAWRRVDDLESAGEENVYTFAPQRGRIRFGDGQHGNIPQEGSKIAVSYVSGPHDGFIEFYSQMKAVDPTIHVGSGFNSPIFVQEMGDDNPYDFIVAHSYSYFRATPGDLDELHDLMMVMTDEQAAKVQALRDAIDAYAGSRADDVGIVLSEYAMATGVNIGLGRIDAPLRYTATLDGALYVARLLSHWVNLGLEVAQKHTLIDIDPRSRPPGYVKPRTAYQAIIGPYPCFVLSATGHALRLFTSMTGDRQVSADVIANPTKRVFNGKEFPALSLLASVDGRNRLYLIVTNADRSKEIEARVRVSGFEPAGTGTVWTLNGSGLRSLNSERDPNAVNIEEAMLRGVDRDFIYSFPSHSVTAIRLSGELTR